MTETPETILTDSHRVKCDGSTGIRATGDYKPSALGHPRVWLEIDERGLVDCGYCDARFILRGGPADNAK